MFRERHDRVNAIRSVPVIVDRRPLAAARDDFARHNNVLILRHCQKGDIDHMNTPVGGSSTAGVLAHPPAPVDDVRLVWLWLGRTQPGVIVESLGWLGDRLSTDVSSVRRPSSDMNDLSERPTANKIDRLNKLARAALPSADLDYSFVPPVRFDHRLSLHDVVTQGLFNVDFLTGLRGVDELDGMPVIWRSDDDRIDILTVKELAIVLVGIRHLALSLFSGRKSRGNLGVVDVAQGRNLDVLDVHEIRHVARPHDSGADHANCDLVVRAHL